MNTCQSGRRQGLLAFRASKVAVRLPLTNWKFGKGTSEIREDFRRPQFLLLRVKKPQFFDALKAVAERQLFLCALLKSYSFFRLDIV